MAFSAKTIRDGLYTWVTGVTGLQTIWLNPNAPRPKLPYITLNMTDFQLMNWDWISPPDDDGMAYLLGDREFLLEVQYYGDNKFDVMEKLRSSLQIPTIRESLLNAGVVFVNRESLMDLTELLDTKYEQRIIMELKFRVSNQGVTDVETFEIGYIETVSGEGTFKNIDGSVVLKTEIEGGGCHNDS